MSRTLKSKLSPAQLVRRSLGLSPLIWLLGPAACSSVLGIEDLHSGPRGGGGTDSGGGSQNEGGTKNSMAGTTNSDAGGGNQPHGGAHTGGGANANGGANPNGGASPVAGSPGDAGAAGATPVDGAVHGTVIDFFGRGLPNLVVQIGDQTVSTDAQGKFTADNVPTEYDVSLKISRESGDKISGWVYQGLTLRNPTLQVYQGREDRGSTNTLYVTGAVLGANDTITVALGTADGSTYRKGVSVDDPSGTYYAPEWQGPATVQGTEHALQWTVNPANSLPSAYKSYDFKVVALVEGMSSDVTFALTPAKAPTSKTITGTVASTGNGSRTNGVFVRFGSGANIQVVDDSPTVGPFSYLVPQISGAGIAIAASERAANGAYGLVHRDGLNPGDAVGTLTIPIAATPLSPAAAADLADVTTPFTFSGSTDSKGAFVIHIEATQFNQSMYIVTSKKKFTLPSVAGYSWVSQRVYYWQVETFGSFATVDQMAGPNGFADTYYGPTQWSGTGEPEGLHQDSGAFTISARNFFTFK